VRNGFEKEIENLNAESILLVAHHSLNKMLRHPLLERDEDEGP